jgi:AcrR family transcriptional regulator
MVSQESENRNESRQRILDTARDVFAEKGFDGARVDEIAQRAGVNKALIYYYFKSKDQLLQEILRTFLDERRTSRPKSAPKGDASSLPDQIARYDVEFLFERRDILRIAMMEDLRSSRDRNLASGTVLKSWLEGLVEARKDYVEAGYGFRYTPRVVVAMYFLHMLPIVTFCAMGETLARETGMDFDTVREEFLKLIVEMNTHHFHSVFGNSVTDPTPEVALPGLVPIPPSEIMTRIRDAFCDGSSMDAGEIKATLATIVDDSEALFEKMLSYGYFSHDKDGMFHWCVPAVAVPSPQPAQERAPQDHIQISPEERVALVAKHMPKGRLEKFPLKEKARVAVIEHIAAAFRSSTVYSEREVDAILKPLASDHTKARRYLVDYGFLRRTPDGSRYWTWDTDPS